MARILVMAKAPRPGQVKTRLIPALGPVAAADLQAELLRALIARLAGWDRVSLELWCDPDAAHPLFVALGRQPGVSLHRQPPGDLGARLHWAAADALTRAERVLLIGADCPLLDRDYCDLALEQLDAADAVLGPAEDGGYVLLGLRRCAPELFEGVPWGSERVAEVTRERLRALGWRCQGLPVLWDLDRPGDLSRYRALLGGFDSGTRGAP